MITKRQVERVFKVALQEQGKKNDYIREIARSYKGHFKTFNFSDFENFAKNLDNKMYEKAFRKFKKDFKDDTLELYLPFDNMEIIFNNGDGLVPLGKKERYEIIRIFITKIKGTIYITSHILDNEEKKLYNNYITLENGILGGIHGEGMLSDNLASFDLFVNLMVWLDYINGSYSVKIIDNKSLPREERRRVKREYQKASGTINLNSKELIKRYIREKESNKRGNKITKQFEVRGHWVHRKDGTKYWRRGYVKGKHLEEKTNKDYNIS
ncbi:hypothetical protein Goe21_01160 [Bacillus phage vB_BsuM-Goe21]|nr:hypothetical protein Goe21_01160 [Bacillus phage vB_BsuM-Goe21]